MSLALELLQQYEGPLVWGLNDCVQFAAAAVRHYGGRAPELPKYSSEREAREIIARGGGLEALVTRVLGEPIPIRDASLGDVALTSFLDTGEMLGVVSLDPRGRPLIVVRAVQGGFIPLRLDFATQVWPCRA